MPSVSDLKLENAVVRKLEGKPAVVSTQPLPTQNAYTVLQNLIDEIETQETDEKKLALKDFRALQSLKNARTNMMLQWLIDEVCKLKNKK